MSSPLEKVLQEITKFSEKKEDWEKLVKAAKEWPKLIKRNIGYVDAALGMLRIDVNTYGYLQILAQKADGEIKEHLPYIEQVRDLCVNGDERQLQLDAKSLSRVCRKMVESLQLTDSWNRGVYPLKRAVEKLRSEKSGGLTPIHADLCQVALKAKMYDVALRVLDQPCYEINKDSDMGALDFLLFHYYGGMIFIGLKQLERALEFFQMALVVESQVISAVQVAAYKKYVLCSLLVHGDVAEIPEKMSPSVAFVQRTCRRICQGYHDLARAYQKGPEALQKLIVEIAEDLHKDQNFGLAKQIVKALVRRNIQRLTNTYVTLALGDIASRAKLSSAAEAEEYVLRMIEDGSIHARIDQKKGMISFLEESEEFDSTPQAQALDRKLKEVIALSEQIKKKQREVELTPQYVSIVMPPERDERDMLGGRGDMAIDPMLARALADSMRG